MKNFRRLGLAVSVCVLAGCSSTGIKLPDWVPSFTASQSAPVSEPQAKVRNSTAPGELTVNDGSGEVTIQTVEFRSGTSSASVERLARRHGCSGTTGAGLITDKGPVEVYRMKCDNGTTFMAQCELRQCRPMR